ncbi:GDSL esterase/lipase At4g16230 isoform X1 [Daucus carota subsp. sativus]|uniref:Uncharacterized protein n=2 Tax=Daucus carota subsp. sativus TaxID=79200 RepID=A0A164SKC7_DAUCS|nr:PREDICTED: GDSL esterase/lipase At4g16230-like isoform X1 [Daucus carota subsp. sativus]
MAKLLHRMVVTGDAFQILILLFVQLGICLAAERFSASFVFGDSLVEAGNNNYIQSLSKANYPPNGIDFGKPTGRYTNNRTIVDIIGQQVGFKDFTPPYLAPTTRGAVILKGVNYASGGGGIVNETGALFVGRINFDAQIDYFANTRQDIISQIGAPAAARLLETALFSITIGSNDFLNNYLVPVVTEVRRRIDPPEVFINTLISRYRVQLTRLYNLGGRKFIVPNVGPLGCTPYQRDVNLIIGDNCATRANQIVQSFNRQLKSLLTELTAKLSGSTFLYANVNHIFVDILQNYKSYGFENANSACCFSAGRRGGIIPCGPGPSAVCPDRSKYVFWDAYHPSDVTNSILAKRLMDGNTDDISPFNLRQLAQL